MTNPVAPKSPPFIFTYWNPFSDKSNLIENWFSYIKNVSVAKYAADSVGRYIQETSADQIQAIDATGKKICGQLYTGFSALENQLGLVSSQLDEIDSRLGLLVDETKTSNLLLENVAELLRIPESQKQRQHHIEMGLKFLKNALKDEDLYQDALTELLGAEKLMPSDYFVLHRIGMIYFYVPALGNLEKATEYFTRAGKYAAVESDPNAARLSNILNKRVNKKFGEQEDSASHEVAEMAAESYLQAGAALYALGRFEEAAKTAEKAVKQQPQEPKHHFFLAKYLARSGEPDAAVPHLQKAVELVPEMALAAVGDFDLNKSQLLLDLLDRLDVEVRRQLQHNVETLKDWPQNGYQYQEVQKLVMDSQEALTKGNYAERVLLLAKLKEWEPRLPFVSQLAEIAAFGISFDVVKAVEFLGQNNPENVERAWIAKILNGFCLFPELQKISVKSNPTFIERLLLATANGQLIPYEKPELIETSIKFLLTEKEHEDRGRWLDYYYDITQTDQVSIISEFREHGIINDEEVCKLNIFIKHDLICPSYTPDSIRENYKSSVWGQYLESSRRAKETSKEFAKARENFSQMAKEILGDKSKTEDEIPVAENDTLDLKATEAEYKFKNVVADSGLAANLPPVLEPTVHDFSAPLAKPVHSENTTRPEASSMGRAKKKGVGCAVIVAVCIIIYLIKTRSLFGLTDWVDIFFGAGISIFVAYRIGKKF